MTTSRPTSAARGCGYAGVLGAALAVVMVVSLTAWLMSINAIPSPGPARTPAPTTLPPSPAQQPTLIDVHAPGRTANNLEDWAAPIAQATNVSPQAVRAYGNAAIIAAEAWPGCNLTWNTLAGVGWVETRHGTYTGRNFDPARLTEAGIPDPPIFGPPLNGKDGFAYVPDTDGGALDNDAQFDRAMGPMQFIPESWARFGRDADGDGVPNPQQIDDAALSAANLLCDGGRDLATAEGWKDAIFAYNHSNDYVAKVRDAAANYAMNQPAHR